MDNNRLLHTIWNCEYHIVEAEICLDHIHLLVEIPPKMSVADFIGYLEEKSTLVILERYPTHILIRQL